MMNGEGMSERSFLHSARVEKLVLVFLVVASLLLGAKALNAIINFDTTPQPAGNVISVEGIGKVSAVPDVATISFSVSENAETASIAQTAATKKINVALAVVDEFDIEEKDIKTSSYNVYPRYSNPTPCYSYPCAYDDSQRIIGYSASQTVEIKVRNIDDVGKILSALGDAGVSNIYGPNFTIDDEEALRAEARREAIEAAREKAKVLADDLDVRLVRVVSFWENSGGYPMYYGRDMAEGLGGAVNQAKAPEVPAGENEIVINVSISYEIR